MPVPVHDAIYEAAVTVEHGVRAGRLPGPHRDPFDQTLIARAQTERLEVVTADPAFERYGAATFW